MLTIIPFTGGEESGVRPSDAEHGGTEMSEKERTSLIQIVTGNKWNSLETYELLTDLNQRTSLSPSEIADQYDVALKTARKSLSTLSNLDIVILKDLEAQLSGFGRVVVNLQKEVFDHMDPETLSSLGRTESDVAVLSVLRLGPLDNNTIEESCEISDSTRRRVIGTYTDKGWVKRTGGQYQLTNEGRDGIAAYQEFVSDILNMYDKSRFFVGYGGPVDGLPTEAIRDATMVEYEKNQPHADLTAFREVVNEIREESEIKEIRAVCPIFSPPIIEFCAPLIADGAAAKCVLGDKAYRRIQKPNNISQLMHFKDYSQVDVRVHDNVLHYGVGMINDDASILVHYSGEDTNAICLHSKDERLVEWAGDVYKEKEAESHTVKEFLGEKAKPSFMD